MMFTRRRVPEAERFCQPHVQLHDSGSATCVTGHPGRPREGIVVWVGASDNVERGSAGSRQNGTHSETKRQLHDASEGQAMPAVKIGRINFWSQIIIVRREWKRARPAT